MILAELDNKETKKKLSLSEYHKKQTSLREHCALVEHIYNLYYPDEETVFKWMINEWIMLIYKINMQRNSERNTRSRSTRKFRFFTDT